ncbi:MAG: DOPA 4,5-dioxygenase family protein [Alphaproteobacteria bacterium]|nr:DOPA 4,5-dioxygenase family protein [Alphaproteobacteria bacterium]
MIAADGEKTTDMITGYHAHVYFDAASEPAAATLRDAIDRKFDTELGRWHRKPVGPHPAWMYQVAFAPAQFAELVPYLALNRSGLSVLVHPMTGDALADHLDHALWLGEPLTLDPEPLKRA